MSEGWVQVVAFYSLAALMLGSAGVVALSRNIIYSTIALLGTFIGAAGMYIQLSADFLAAIQILVYVGGTLTLLLFAVMLTAKVTDIRSSNTSRGRPLAFGVVILLLLLLGRVANHTDWPAQARAPIPSTTLLGHAFLGPYLLPFEVASVLLLGALVGAVVLARRAVRPEGEKEE